jgi:tRNA dimethylallyltransferase
VDQRIAAGVEKEIKNLLKKGVSWGDQSMTSLGYRQWKGYFAGEKEKAAVVSGWKTEEKKYAKRQMTWFKRDKRINWFDITNPQWSEKVEILVKKWYK